MRKQSDKTKILKLRGLLKAALNCLDTIGRTPDLPDPERQADWKNCMKNSSYNARATAKCVRINLNDMKRR